MVPQIRSSRYNPPMVIRTKVLVVLKGLLLGCVALGAAILAVPDARMTVFNATGLAANDAAVWEALKRLPLSTVSQPSDEQQSRSFLFLGDIMLDREVRARMARAKEPQYPFHKMVENDRAFFRSFDAVIANLEGPVTTQRRGPEKTIDFAFNPSVVTLLHDIGIQAVSQANNHQLDQGRTGADESRVLLTAGGVYPFGDQVKDDAASSLWVLDRDEMQTAFLGFNTTDNPIDREVASSSITIARAQADRVVVFMHWGNEYQAKPSAAQTELAHWFIDRGVDAVIGAHPHWMQSVEVYRNRPIAYSLGNFVFDQDWSIETRHGLVAGVRFLSDRTEVQLYPIQIDRSVPRLLTGKERTTRLERLASISDSSLGDMIRRGVIEITLNP